MGAPTGYARRMGRDTVEARLRYIAANIRRIRHKRGWTQAELADEASLELRYVQTLESGKANPTAATIVRVADALQVKPGTLFRRAILPAKQPGRPKRR